jgi:DNA-binding transcriptional regulator YiaG
MPKTQTVAQEIVESLREFTEVLESGQPIHEKFTCRRVTLDLKQSAYGPKDVKRARQVLNLSQVLFAQFLGVSTQAVRAWEQGTNTPNDSATRLMDEIRRDPAYWRARLRQLVTVRQIKPREVARTSVKRPVRQRT